MFRPYRRLCRVYRPKFDQVSLGGNIWRNLHLSPKTLTFYNKAGFLTQRFNLPIPCVNQYIYSQKSKLNVGERFGAVKDVPASMQQEKWSLRPQKIQIGSGPSQMPHTFKPFTFALWVFFGFVSFCTESGTFFIAFQQSSAFKFFQDL